MDVILGHDMAYGFIPNSMANYGTVLTTKVTDNNYVENAGRVSKLEAGMFYSNPYAK